MELQFDCLPFWKGFGKSYQPVKVIFKFFCSMDTVAQNKLIDLEGVC